MCVSETLPLYTGAKQKCRNRALDEGERIAFMLHQAKGATAGQCTVLRPSLERVTRSQCSRSRAWPAPGHSSDRLVGR